MRPFNMRRYRLHEFFHPGFPERLTRLQGPLGVPIFQCFKNELVSEQHVVPPYIALILDIMCSISLITSLTAKKNG